jgi:hypothetical protein
LIVGSVLNGSPYVTAHVQLARLHRKATIDFLIDTGSTTTLINPDAWRRLGLRVSDLEGLPRVSSRGLGGSHSNYVDTCDFYFPADDGLYELFTGLRARFAPPSVNNSNLPALLGMDVLQHFRLTLEAASGVVLLESPHR